MPRRLSGCAGVVLAVLVLACGPSRKSNAPGARAAQQPSGATSPAAASSTSAVPDTADLLRGIYHGLRSLGRDRLTVRNRLGEPRAATTSTQPDPNDSAAVDTLVQWRYEQLDFTFLLVGQEILAETRAAADYAAVASLCRELSTVEAAQARLGVPAWTQTRGDTTVLGYPELEAEGGAENSITLHFVKGRLVQVGALPFLD